MESEERLIEFSDFFRISGYSFKLIGLNPFFESKKASTKIRQNKPRFNSFLTHFCFWLTSLTTVLEIIFCLSIIGDMDHFLDFCKTFSCFLFDFMAVLEMLLIRFSGNDFRLFILELEQLFPSDKGTQEKYKIQRQAKDTNLVLKRVFSAFIFCFFIWIIGSPTYDVLYCYFTDKKYTLEVPFKIYLPWNPDDPVPYFIAFFLEVVTIYASVLIVVSVNMFFLAIVAQLRLQFVMLAQNIRDLPPRDFGALRNVIKLHNHLIKVSGRFTELLSWTMLSNYFFSSGAICCALFEMVTSETSEKIRFLVYLMVVLIQTLTMSFVGETLEEYVSGN